MNKTFKSVWSCVRQCYVAVDENKSTQRNSGKLIKTVAVSSMLAIGSVVSLSAAMAEEITFEALKNFIDSNPTATEYDRGQDTLNNGSDKSVLIIGKTPTENPSQDANYLSWSKKSNVLSLASVKGVSGGIEINDGFKFKLLGTEEGGDLADGPVFINEGEFGLGVETEGNLSGNIQTVNAAKGSNFTAYGGKYNVSSYVATSGEDINPSQVIVKKPANLTIDTFTSSDSTITNDGTLTIGTYDSSEGSAVNTVKNQGTLSILGSLNLMGGKFDNEGTVAASEAQISVSGKFISEGTKGTAVINAKSIAISDDGSEDSGFTNGNGSSVKAEEISFVSGHSFYNADGATLETIKLQIAPEEDKGGLNYRNSGTTKLSDLQIGSTGKFANQNKLEVSSSDKVAPGQINGQLLNTDGSLIQGDGRLTIGSGGVIDTRGGQINGIDLAVTGSDFRGTNSQKNVALVANNNSKILLNNFIVNTTNKDDVVLDFTASTSKNLVPTFKNMDVASGTLKFGNLSNADVVTNGVVNVGNAGVVSFNNGVLLSLTNSGSVTATGTFSTPVGINHGKLTVEEFISNEGDKFTNSGSFELTGTKTPIINGQFTNDLGNFSGKWNNLSIGATGEFVNQ